jgi:hypothetical protein
MRKRRTIPTIIGISIVFLGVVLGVFATQYKTFFRTSASNDTTPQGVRITNVFDNSFTVSWVTTKPATGALEWGVTSLGEQIALEDQSLLKEVHSITLSNLNANTTYYFKIRSGGELIDNNGIPWQVKTGPSLQTNTKNNVTAGTVLTQSGQPAANVLVYVTAGNMAPLSVKTSSNGSWILPLGSARTTDNSSYAAIEKTTLLNIFVQGGSAGISTAQSFVSTSNPTPPITLGQTYDFRNEEISQDDNTPESRLDLPETTPDNPPGFTTDTEIINSTNDQSTVTLESIKEDGELVATTKPEFFGDGPPGEILTITVESDPITESVTVPTSGAWKWQPPTNLPAGEHKLTIKWRDEQGILRTLIRSFVVYASDDPAFVSTPSATQDTPAPLATPRVTAAPTPIVTASPTIVPTATPTASPRVSQPATSSGTPIAGSLTPTLALSIMGVALVVLSLFVVYKIH